MAATPVTRQLQRLARIKPGKHPIVSCYLKIEPRDRVRGKYLIKLKNRIRQTASQLARLGLVKADADAVVRDLQRIQAALATPDRLPATQGVAIFASEGVDLFEMIPLPRVHRSRLLVDRTPLVRELVALEDDLGRVLTALVDRTGARIFEVGAFDAREVVALHADASRGGKFHSDRHGAPGVGEHGWHNRIRNEKQRHLDAVAQALFTLWRKQPADGIVLAGPGPEAGALQDFLHPYLQERVMGVVRLNLKNATPADIHDASLVLREAYDRMKEHHLLEDLSDAIGTGLGVNGMKSTLKALARGQVRTLVVRADAVEPGFRMETSGRLVLTDKEGRTEGRAIPVLDVVDDAIEEALRQRVTVEVVYEDDVASAVQGLAAILRFR